ncbi:GNAT family N-acetyltransferase [Streptomyces sp. AC495_CC817]|uniref:GNAT family N-acetyltransferase n=1 Tax=Streptomyces sp. AC495_CC817 TaxID=2823900 RepID=UPI001C260743|nr:GNAT family N-acetyltransferase [Streptomyces sp. AC495_CC817]
MTLVIRAVEHVDRPGWQPLFEGYRDFYGHEPDPAVIETVWSWLRDADHELNGLVALQGERVVGIAHWRTFARPSRGGRAIFLDDLYTDPAARGSGVGTALVDRLREIAARDGLLEVRWITSESNTDAQRLYDRIAQQLPIRTYSATPATA